MYFPLLAWIDRVACIHSVAQSIAKKKGPLLKIPNVTSKLWSRLRAIVKWLLYLSISLEASKQEEEQSFGTFSSAFHLPPLPANRFQLWSAPNLLLVRFLWLTFPSRFARSLRYLSDWIPLWLHVVAFQAIWSWGLLSPLLPNSFQHPHTYLVSLIFVECCEFFVYSFHPSLSTLH